MVRNIRISLLSVLLLSSFLNAQGNGEALFKQCAGCHGADGHNKAFGKSGIIAGQSVEELMESLKFYKESEFKGQGSTLVMAKQLKTFNAKDLADVVEYISKLPK